MKTFSALSLIALCTIATATEVTVAVNDYVGMNYAEEPVSFVFAPDAPVAASRIGIIDAPSQVEILEGTPEAVTKARVWTRVSFRKEGGGRLPGIERHKLLTIVDDGRGQVVEPTIVRRDGGAFSGQSSEIWASGTMAIRVPVGNELPDTWVPGPILQVGTSPDELMGWGWIDAPPPVTAVARSEEHGPIFSEQNTTYTFANGGTYTVRVRLWPHRWFVTLDEDFSVGGNAKSCFSYGDWATDGIFRTGDSGRGRFMSFFELGDPTGDFVRQPGSLCLARMMVWNQFGYFRGKQETIGLKATNPESLPERYAKEKEAYDKRVANWEKKGKKGTPPTLPDQPDFAMVPYTVGEREFQVGNINTPRGLGIGGFYRRPDLWTRAKVNHIDLWLRPADFLPLEHPEINGGLVPIMESWLVDGHRQWALYAVEAGNEARLKKAHVVHGVWSLDRLNALPLVWNSDGSPVAPENTVPGDGGLGASVGGVMHATTGRCGLQVFNGSNGNIRGRYPHYADLSAIEVTAGPEVNNGLATFALDAYFSSDDSAYPSIRAMLPWTHEEALNPLYQGMENMNFNADLYRYVLAAGVELERRAHPDAKRFIDHAKESFDMALDRYVYPQSGCWEESHGYASHTIHTVTPLVNTFKAMGLVNFWQDQRFIAMVNFFAKVYSPVDRDLTVRVVPPIGDHGLSMSTPAGRLGKMTQTFIDQADDQDAQAQRLALSRKLIASDLAEAPHSLPSGSNWLQGYGAVMRADGGATDFVTVTFESVVAGRRKAQPVGMSFGLKDGVVQLPAPPQRPGLRVGSRRALWATTDFKDENGVQVLEGTITTKGRKNKLGIPLPVRITRTAEGAVSLAMISEGEANKTFEGVLRNVPRESMVTLRAGQSWGHHHSDKGSLWGWFHNVIFFGDASWGGPPGGTYWNFFKQGPGSGTQMEFKGINNWTLPCKYPAPWISDYAWADEVDYARASCLYPFNPKVDLSRSTPVALSNGYERQTLFVKPDLLIVRDNVSTTSDTVWRYHAYQPIVSNEAGTVVQASPVGVNADLIVAYPPKVALSTMTHFPDINPYNGKPSSEAYAGKPFGTTILSFEPPFGSSVSWTVGGYQASDVTNAGAQYTTTALDDQGKVLKTTCPDGSTVISFMADDPFTAEAEGWIFAGSVGLVIIPTAGDAQVYLIRGERLEELNN